MRFTAPQVAAAYRQRTSLVEVVGLILALVGVATCLLLNFVPVDAITAPVLVQTTRALPIVLVLGSVPFLILGASGRRSLRFKATIAGTLLAVMMVGGSLAYIAEQGQDISQSFLVRGVCAFSLLAGAAIGANPAKRRQFARFAAAIAIVPGMLGLLLLFLFQFGLVGSFQPVSLKVEATIFIAGPAYYVMRNHKTLLAMGMVFALALLGVLSGKSTFYLLALLLLGLYFSGTFLRWIRAIMKGRSSTAQAGLFSALIPIAIGLILLLSNLFAIVIDERISRNTSDVRVTAYQYRLSQFADSPIWGQGFNLTSNMADVMGFGTQVPSHNDVLDLAAGGGLIAVLLYFLLLGTATLNRTSFRHLSDIGRKMPPEMFFWCLLIFYLVSATGNPFFSTPKLAVLVWFSAGFMASYARVQPRPIPGPQPVMRPPLRPGPQRLRPTGSHAAISRG